MTSRLKVFFQYFIIIFLTLALVWFSLQGLQVGEEENKWKYLQRTWEAANKGWLLLMAVVALLSHLARAERWRLLMVPAGYHVKLSNSFYSLMVGYLVNLVIPRGGEVSRCYNLYKLEKAPVDTSFGTVVIERLADVVCLMLLIALSFFLESKKLLSFIATLPIGTSQQNNTFTLLLYGAGVAAVVFIIAYIVFKNNAKLGAFVIKTWAGFRAGFSSVSRMENKSLFVFYSVVIWLLYFLMSYTVIKAFPSTSVLGWGAVLSLFAIGAIAMAAPLPGGTGAYHVLVPQGLVFLYALPRTDAVAFTFIFHGWQTLIMIFGGAISLLVTSYVIKRDQKKVGRKLPS